MPVVNHPLGQIRDNVTFPLSPRGSLRLLADISIAAAAFSLILALCRAVQDRRKKGSGKLVAHLAEQGKSLSLHLTEGYWIKSRGVSNAVQMDMSANQHSAHAQFELDVGLVPLISGEQRVWTRNNAGKLHGNGLDVVEPDVTSTQPQRARPPPPLPMTPPALTAKIIPFEGRRLSSALSMTYDLDSSFFSQPNPDYASSSSSPALTQPDDHPVISKRRSYTKNIPLGPPQPVSWLEDDGSVSSFSPSSFPSSSPILQLAPHESFHTHDGIDVRGEVLSVTDNIGTGWRRHTRVYGGGACLACMASPDREGGFYGNRVRPEEKR